MIGTIKNSVTGLARFLHSGLQQNLEPNRLAKAGYSLLASGCSSKGDFPGARLAARLVESQQKDGGWADVEETLWCLGYLSAFRERYGPEINKGQEWLASVKMPCGAWGKSKRDQPRIPVTALTAVLAPDNIDETSLEWLEKQWKSDMDNPTQLSYKGAYYLIAQQYGKASLNSSLMHKTVIYLVGEQSDDGGFAPWKDHPVGSDPWTTGIVLWGLSALGEQAPRETVKRAASWLETGQLPNGLWPYHYIDDGSSMALMGLSKSLPILEEW